MPSIQFNTKNRKKMIATMSNYLEDIGVAHATDVDSGSLKFEIETTMGDAPCFFIFNGEEGVAIYSCLPVQVPKNKISEVALYLSCLNNNRFWGCFEMDLKTRNVYFRTYIDLTEMPLTTPRIEKSMSANLSVLQQHLMGILELF